MCVSPKEKIYSDIILTFPKIFWYFSFPTDVFTCTEQKSPEENEVQYSLQNYGFSVWN